MCSILCFLNCKKSHVKTTVKPCHEVSNCPLVDLTFDGELTTFVGQVLSKEMTLTNMSDEKITKIEFASLHEPFSLERNDCNTELHPQTSCKITVNLFSNQTGSFDEQWGVTLTIFHANTSTTVGRTLSLKANIAASPISLSYGQDNETSLAQFTWTIGESVELIPSTSGLIAEFAISPALPSGLSFDAKTGIIRGTALATQSATIYKVTAKAQDADFIQTAQFEVAIIEFNETTVGHLRYWFDASYPGSVTQDQAGSLACEFGSGNQVKGWTNRVKDGPHLINFSSRLPTFIKGINGLPAIKFSKDVVGGQGTTLKLVSADRSQDQNTFEAVKTIYAVFRITDETKYWASVYSNRGSGSCCALFTSLQTNNSGDDVLQKMETQGAGDILDIYPSNNQILGKPLISEHVSKVTDPFVLWIGGQIGEWLPLMGEIYEMLWFEGELSEKDRAKVRGYLSVKYNIPLDLNNPTDQSLYNTPSRVATSISFTDTDNRPGYVAGTVTIGRASDGTSIHEETIESYHLYWATDEDIKLSNTPFALLAKPNDANATFTYTLPSPVLLPSGAKKILVVTANGYGEMTFGRSAVFTDAGS